MKFIRKFFERRRDALRIDEIPLDLHSGDSGFSRYLSVATMIRGESEYVLEWTAFYKILGVDKITIYANGDDSSLRKALEFYIQERYVEIIPWLDISSNINMQRLAFAHAIKQSAGKSKWLAILDIDEFLFPIISTDLPDVLKKYEDYAGLAVYWTNFGTSGRQSKPEGLVIESYLQRTIAGGPGLTNVKSIVQPHLVAKVNGAHVFPMISGKKTVDEKGNTVSPRAAPSWAQNPSELQLNHYYSRSQQEFDDRLEKGWAASNQKLRAKRINNLSLIEQNTVSDTRILRFAEALKHEMARTQ